MAVDYTFQGEIANEKGTEAVLAVMKKQAERKLIVQKLCTRERLEALAEEAAELSQAALKLIRACRFGETVNPTPLTAEEALENLYEEIADVELAVEVLNVGVRGRGKIDGIKDTKRERWAKRLEGEKTNE